jgi:hypothetical protein
MSFLENLSPGERLGEVLFGLIMTLTFTLGAGLVFGEAEGASRSLLIATVGSSVAWGVIDSALFLLGTLFDRGRQARLHHAIAAQPDEACRVAIVANELDETLVPITSDEQRIDLYRDIVANVKTGALERATLHRVDFAAAAVVFISVVSPTLPAALPYLLISDPLVALRASNALLIAMLFWVGYRWAGYTNLDPRVASLMVAVVGIVLVLVAIVLGG